MTPDEVRVDVFRFLEDEYGVFDGVRVSLQGKRIVIEADGSKVIVLVSTSRERIVLSASREGT